MGGAETAHRARWRRGLGGLLVLHGLAHALAGMRAAQASAAWLDPAPPEGATLSLAVLTLLWTLASSSLVAAGLGALGARPFRRRWRSLAAAGVAASLLLLVGFHPPTATPGIVLDLGLVILLWRAGGILDWVPVDRPVHRERLERVLAGAVDTVAVLGVAYLAVVLGARPWTLTWGSSAAELHTTLEGDAPPATGRPRTPSSTP